MTPPRPSPAVREKAHPLMRVTYVVMMISFLSVDGLQKLLTGQVSPASFWILKYGEMLNSPYSPMGAFIYFWWELLVVIIPPIFATHRELNCLSVFLMVHFCFLISYKPLYNLLGGIVVEMPLISQILFYPPLAQIFVLFVYGLVSLFYLIVHFLIVYQNWR
jgi:hypothetical protein